MEFSLRLSISMQQACVQLFFDFNAQRTTGKQRQRPLSNLQSRCGVRLPLSHLLLRRTLLFKITAALHFNRDSRRVYDSDFFGCNCAPRTFSSHIWRLALLESFFPIVIHSLHLMQSRMYSFCKLSFWYWGPFCLFTFCVGIRILCLFHHETQTLYIAANEYFPGL